MALRPANVLPQPPFVTQHDAIWDGLDQLVEGGQLYQHQVDAVRAVKADFNAPNPDHGEFRDVSLVVLPTGTGKSGVAVLAAYCCNVVKVLVVTPSVVVANQVFADFQYQDGHDSVPFLERRDIFTYYQRRLYMPYGALIRRTSEMMAAVVAAPLVVANAQKFGARSGVDLAKIPPDFPLVIIDEAHHYPAQTWLNIVTHFAKSKILFLTATPFHKDAAGRQKYILGPKRPCYQLEHAKAIDRGIIRPTQFVEVTGGDTRNGQIQAVLNHMRETLDDHNRDQPKYRHQGLILATDIVEAHNIADLWNNQAPEHQRCAAYVTDTPREVLENFKTGKLDVLVIIYRLTEGFDRKNVSVVGILRNVQPTSRVYFSQFVGRAVRKLDADDNVTAKVISHAVHIQRRNYELFELEHEFVAEDDPTELDNE